MKNSGFTLVELVMILIVVGVLAVAAVPRLLHRETFDARSYFDQVQAMLRYAQKIAIAQRRNVFVRLDGASAALCFDNNFVNGCEADDRVPAPAGRNSGRDATLAACSGSETWFCEAAPADIASTAANFYFNALGKPFNPADVAPVSSFTGTLDIAITGDGMTRHVFVERETGYVHP
jgi:MSHA pilin protein MshC